MKYLASQLSYLLILFICVSSDSLGQVYNATQASNRSPATHNFTVPEPVGFVNDFENLFTSEEIKTLDSKIIDIHNTTSVQIAIITIDSMMVDKDHVEDFSKETFKSWGLQANGHFNGILIVLSNAYKKLYVENGTGVEQVLTDYEIQDIIENAFIPNLKDENYYVGTTDGLTAILNKLKVK